ncbi:MAG: VacJ family lipoprotein [Alphaproteobacteria bacterium]
MRIFFALFLLSFFAWSPCVEAKDSTATQASYDEDDLDSDPLEFMNRPVFEFNRVVDGILIDPFAAMYKSAVPIVAQNRVTNFLDNLVEPITMVNDSLQAKPDKVVESFCRFLLNTVFGVLGLFDVAEKLGLPAHKESFNTTLKYWGVPQGPYIVLPVLGPASPRFILGLGVDYFTDPFNYYMIQNNETGLMYTRTVARFMITRADMVDDIKNFRETSIDFYAAMRSFYKQYMNANREGDTVQYNSPSLKEFMFDD